MYTTCILFKIENNIRHEFNIDIKNMEDNIMLRACYLLKDSINKISRIGKTMTANSDLDVIKNRIRYEYRNALVYYNELSCIISIGIDDVQESFETFDGILKNILNLQDHTTIKNELLSLPSNTLGNFIDNLDEFDLMRKCKNLEWDDETCTSLGEDDLKKIARCFSTTSNRPINLLDARCYRGYNANEIRKMSMEELKLYGMEINSSRANEAKLKKHFEKVAKGGLKGCKCSNDAFDIALLYPKTTFKAEFTPMNTLKPRIEVEEIRQVTNYIRKDGLLILVIPFYRLTSQLCTIIAKNYTNVTLTKAKDTWNQLLIVVGQKKDQDDGDDATYNLLRRMSLDINESDNEVLGRYELPPDLLSIDLFRGNILDDEDIEYIVNSTSLYDSFMEKQENILESLDKQQPLLPFNIGQIGLVLTSGCLDGEIEELEGHYHVIKGMVRKDEIIEEIEGDKKGDKETRTTYINKVQINVVAPDGTFKTLA